MATLTFGKAIERSKPAAAGQRPVIQIGLAPREACRIECRRPGLQILARTPLWITQPNDPADYFVAPGSRFTVAHRGRVVLQGMGLVS